MKQRIDGGTQQLPATASRIEKKEMPRMYIHGVAQSVFRIKVGVRIQRQAGQYTPEQDSCETKPEYAPAHNGAERYRIG